MALTADDIIDRRRLAAKLRFWRIVTLVVLAAALIVIYAWSGAAEGWSRKGTDHIARVRIEGFVSNDRRLLELLQSLKKKDRVKAVILDISTPGGSTVGGEAIYEAVRDLADVKPVAASVGTLAASAGYMIACATDQIVARRSSIVGSIGVLFQYGDASELLAKLGVKIDAIKSAPLKAEPSPFHPASEEAKAMIGRVVNDSFEWFVALVAERRGLSLVQTRALADGSVFTGTQGLANRLVDRIGDEETARQWLVSEKKLSDDLKIIEWRPESSANAFDFNPAGLAVLARLAGLEPEDWRIGGLARTIDRALFLDGLTSVMQDYPIAPNRKPGQ